METPEKPLETSIYTPDALEIEWKLQMQIVLFANPIPFSISDLHQQLAEIPQDKLVSLLHELIQDYRNFHGALEIHAFPDSTYQLQAKHDVMIEPGVARFTRGEEFTAAEMQLLSFIAFNQPITLEDIIEFLSPKVKKILSGLIQKGFIQPEPIPAAETESESSPNYITTALFADYMGIANDLSTIKQTIQKYYEQLEQKQNTPHPPKRHCEKIERSFEPKADSLFEIVSEEDFKAAVAKFDEVYK